MVDVYRSTRLCEVIQAKHKECFDNARLGQMYEPDLLYTEGYILFELSDGCRVPITHGWLETDVGEVVDPTYPLWNDKEIPEYIPVAWYGTAALLALLAKGPGFYPLTMRVSPDLWREETMRIMEMAAI